jgi:hypothetical protein
MYRREIIPIRQQGSKFNILQKPLAAGFRYIPELKRFVKNGVQAGSDCGWERQET